MEAGFAGAANAGRPMLLEGGLKWQAMSLSPADMDFVGLKAAAAREIALAFGVPPMLLGLPGDVSYANYTRGEPRAVAAGGGAAGGQDHARDRRRRWRPGGRGWRCSWTSMGCRRCRRIASGCGRRWRRADFLSDDEKREMLGFAPKEVLR